jgi:PAS domain S-box-containing protein
VVVVALALPYLTGRPLRLLIVSAGVVGAAAVVVDVVLPEQTGVSAWFAAVFEVVSTVTAIGLASLLLWQYANRIEEAAARSLESRLEQEKTEAELRVRETRFRALIENSSDAVALFSGQGRILYGSPSTETVLGYAQEEFVGRSAFELIHPDDQEFVTQRLMESIQRPREHVSVYARVRHRDGAWRWLEGIFTNLLDQPGVEAIVNNYRDFTERKLAIEQVRDSEERFRSLFQQVPISLWENDFSAVGESLQALAAAGVSDFKAYLDDHPKEVLRLAGQVRNLDVNDRTLALFEASSKEAIRDGLSRIFSKYSYLVFKEILVALATGLNHYENELVVYTLKGNPRNVILRINVPPGYEDSLARVLMSTLDITSRKRAEERLRRSNARALALAELSGSFVEAGLDYQPVLEKVTRVISRVIGEGCVIRLVSEDGRWLEAVSVYHPNPAIREMLQSSSGIGRLPISEGWEERLAVRPDDKNLPEVLSPELHPGSPSEIRANIDAIGSRSATIAPLRTQGRNLGTIGVLRTDSEKGYSVADRAFLQEVADRLALVISNARLYQESQQLNLELEQRVSRRTLQLETSNKEMEAFTYSVSHDLRSPLRHTVGYIDLLQRHLDGSLDEKGRRYLGIITAEATRMGNLIDDLLEFSRIGHREMHASSIDFGALVRDVLRDFEPEMAGRRIEWRIDTLPEVNGDRALLRQVWVNLVANALKYTRTRNCAEIAIGCSGADDGHVFFVRDNGVGFDMKYADKLFGIFQRLHRLEDFEGTGIGLANVQQVIHRHGGRVWAEAEEDAGAAFYFTLPTAHVKDGA